jgi:hypothetical protein
VREGPAAGARSLIRSGAATVAHGAKALPPWAAAVGILPPCPIAAGTGPHRPVLPTVGRGVRRQMNISRKFQFDHLFFENHDNKYKKIALIRSGNGGRRRAETLARTFGRFSVGRRPPAAARVAGRTARPRRQTAAKHSLPSATEATAAPPRQSDPSWSGGAVAHEPRVSFSFHTSTT